MIQRGGRAHCRKNSTGTRTGDVSINFSLTVSIYLVAFLFKIWILLVYLAIQIGEPDP